MFKYLVFCLAFINVLSATEAEKPINDELDMVRAEFNALRQDPNNQDALNFLKEQLPNPKSPIWRELGEMKCLSDYDRLPKDSKQHALLFAEAFVKSGGLDILYLWGGQNFAKEDLITVRDYLKNLPEKFQETMLKVLQLPKGWDQFDLAAHGAKADPNLDNPFLVEDAALKETINKWVNRINPVTHLKEWNFEKDRHRSKTNAIGLLTRL